MSVEFQTITGGRTTQQVQITGGSASDGALVDGANSAIKATVKDLTNANPLTVAITDANGDQITSFGGGTQYTEGDTDASITGTAMLGEAAGDALAPVQLDASNNLKVAVQGTVPVSGTFYQATQPVSLASVPSHPVTNAGTFAVQVTSAPTTTVTATDLDVRNLAKTQDEVYAVLRTDAGAAYDARLVTVQNSSIPVTDNAGSLTVDNNGTFAVQATCQANSGVDIGDVTINNAAGASAVNIQDGGNTITVDGTVAVSNASFPVTDNSGSLTVDAPVGTPVFVRLSDGASAIATLPVSIAATVTTKETRASTPSQSSPNVTNSNTSILASNANRLGATIYNEGSATCYMKLGSTASTTSYTLQIASGGYYEVPFNYTGAIDGIKSSGTAQLRVTELT